MRRALILLAAVVAMLAAGCKHYDQGWNRTDPKPMRIY